MNPASHPWILAFALLWTAVGKISAAVDDAISKPVSFQFLNSLDDSPVSSPVISPLVSYQYFEWPGDESVTFQNSPQVSYYFNGPPRIIDQPSSQITRVGASVSLNVGAEGTQPLKYQWYFNGKTLEDSDGATIVLDNVQKADSGNYSVVVSNDSGAVTSTGGRVIVYLPPSGPPPAPLVLVAAYQALSGVQTAQPRITTTDQLRIFGSTTVDPKLMTIVMTHGWRNSSADWPSRMAQTLMEKYANKANILAWDWKSDAEINTLSPVASAGRTPVQGLALANALMNTLGPDYEKQIHFIGHSLGTLVNCRAADYLHGDRRLTIGENRPASQHYDPSNTHMTLLDEAELAVPINSVSVMADVILDNYSLKNGQDNSSAKVIPSRAAYVDNYVSEVGLLHDEAANIMLWRRWGVPLISDISGFGESLHGYACEWYRETIHNPAVDSMGFYWSFERGSVSNYSNSPTPKKNTFFIQSLDLNRSYLSVSQLSGSTAQLLSRKRLVVYPTLKAYQGLNAVGKAAQGVYLSGIQHAGNMVADFVETLNVPTGNPVYSITAGSTPQFFLPAGETPITNLEASMDMQFSIRAGPSQTQQNRSGLRIMSSRASEEGPAYTIIPLTVPNEAAGVSFEYSISGSRVDEFMTMGINSSNEYTMEAKFLDDGAWNGTPVIPVSALRNQEVQLVFALISASGSPSGSLGVRNIRFYIPPRPELTVSKTGDSLTARWPSSAIDWTMETSTDLNDPSSWEPVTEPPTDESFFHTMTFDVSGTSRAFFRLKK